MISGDDTHAHVRHLGLGGRPFVGGRLVEHLPGLPVLPVAVAVLEVDVEFGALAVLILDPLCLRLRVEPPCGGDPVVRGVWVDPSGGELGAGPGGVVAGDRGVCEPGGSGLVGLPELLGLLCELGHGVAGPFGLCGEPLPLGPVVGGLGAGRPYGGVGAVPLRLLVGGGEVIATAPSTTPYRQHRCCTTGSAPPSTANFEEAWAPAGVAG